MDSSEPRIFFKETRLNFEPSSPTLVVDVQLVSESSKNKRQNNGSTRSNADNSTLRAQNCATTSAIYHRKHHQYPKSFLWRVLDDNNCLSLRTVDVCKPEKTPDTNLILNFHFPHAIRPACIALSDPPDHDAIAVFILDEVGQLFTLFLRPDSFRKRSFVEGGLGDSVKIYTVNALQSFKTPYRLIAVNTDQLIVTLTDGGHIRLDRNKPQIGWLLY